MTEESSAAIEAPSTPQRWRVFLAGLSLVLGVVSCLACVFDVLIGIAMIMPGGLLRIASGLDVLEIIMWSIGLFSGLTAILFGTIARKSLPRRERLSPGIRIGKVGIISGSAGIAIGCLYILIIPALIPPRSGYKATCQNNLKQIGVIMRMYALDNQGVLPDMLSRAYPEYATDPTIFVCPQSGNKPGDPARIDEWSDYAYVPGLRITETPADAQALACYDKVYTNHEPPGRNELYLDGHVEYRANRKALSPDQTEF